MADQPAATDRYLHGAYHPNGECPNGMCATERSAAPLLSWPFCRSCGGAGWVGARVDHEHPGCGHRCILCDPPPGYDRTYAVETA